ncbi:prepilin-type N-terminal cleavage/methylation domain-containing protein [Kiritimatiellaeota bacterium B1221]|nr:prepilin-type N-terminal cleavage/methylation domain-containing protein [Kiritimatiellaeota bacterium B1221]
MISKSAKSRGFTLLEILLVVLVIGIATAAFLPVAMKNVESARTRSAVREVIALNRYARARAVLDRRPTAVVYNTGQDKLQLLSLPAQRDTEGDTLFGAASGEEDGSSASTVEVIRDRNLPKYVRVTEVTGAEKEEDGYFVIYQESGVTFSHQVVISAPNGQKRGIHINGLTGEISLDD